MWWLYTIYDFSWPLLTIKELANSLHLQRTVVQFVTLGLIPGTPYKFNFNDVLIAFWLVFFIWASFKLFFRAQKIINKLNPYRHLPPNLTYISLTSL
jgi:hypothetical protein